MNRLRGTLILSLGFLCVTVYDGIAATAPEAKLTIKVLNDDGRALSSMPVHAWLSESSILDGHTDSNGLFVVEGTCTIKDIPISVVKQGYYDSRLTYSYPNYVSVKDDKWQPWNPVVTAVVRRVMNPIPMFMKRVEAKIPVENAPFAFDLQSGDWVEPYGRGQVSDLIFEATRRVTSPNDYEGTLHLTFTNAFDGIQKAEGMVMESAFPFPRLAAAAEYEAEYVYSHGNDPIKGYYGALVDDPKKYYFIRVRSVLDSEGKLKEALYGMLAGDIELTGVASADSVRIAFMYYLNPTSLDRNMEFDPKRNLFTDLAPLERVNEP